MANATRGHVSIADMPLESHLFIFDDHLAHHYFAAAPSTPLVLRHYILQSSPILLFKPLARPSRLVFAKRPNFRSFSHARTRVTKYTL